MLLGEERHIACFPPLAVCLICISLETALPQTEVHTSENVLPYHTVRKPHLCTSNHKGTHITNFNKHKRKHKLVMCTNDDKYKYARVVGTLLL